jgi:hypothetical protein
MTNWIIGQTDRFAAAVAMRSICNLVSEYPQHDIVLWGVLPYVMVVVLVGGLVWRYKYDQFGWTTRSSQLYEPGGTRRT